MYGQTPAPSQVIPREILPPAHPPIAVQAPDGPVAEVPPPAGRDVVFTAGQVTIDGAITDIARANDALLGKTSTYQIAASGLASGNYLITYLAGELIIMPLNVQILPSLFLQQPATPVLQRGDSEIDLSSHAVREVCGAAAATGIGLPPLSSCQAKSPPLATLCVRGAACSLRSPPAAWHAAGKTGETPWRPC